MHLCDVATRKRLIALGIAGSDVNAIAFSPDGKTLALGYGNITRSDGGVAMWDVAMRKRPAKGPDLPMPEGQVRVVAFSPSGKTLAARYGVGGGGGGGVVLWNVASRERQPKDPFLIPESEFGGLAFSHDGNVLAAGCSGVRLWDVAGPGLIAKDPLPVPDLTLREEGSVARIAFSRSDFTLAAAYISKAGTGVALWNLPNRTLLAKDPIPAPSDACSTLAFTPDGKTLAVGYKAASGGGSVILWDVAEQTHVRIQSSCGKEKYSASPSTAVSLLSVMG